MRQALLDLIPEFNEIRDEDLREKAIGVWIDALERSDLTLANIAAMPFTLLAENVEVTFIEHVRTVCKLCMAMERVLVESYGARMPINHDALVAGALLADVGKVIEFEMAEDGSYAFAPIYKHLRHPFTGVGMAWARDLPPEVMHIIATHSWEGAKFKRRPESIIFHHADFTDFHLVQA